MKNIAIAIIGHGRFGQVLVEILLKHTEAKIMLISSKQVSLFHKNLTIGTIKVLKDADVVIPCIPISQFEKVIKSMTPLLQKDAIVMDVCSVKTLPVATMKKHLPENIQIIASHPMFGPDSYQVKKSLSDLKLVLWNVRAKRKDYLQIKNLFSKIGIKIVELSPSDHDKFMAMSLGYSYLIGKLGQKMNIKKTPIDTYDFQLLLEHEAIVASDSEELFHDMQTNNPFAKAVQRKLEKTVASLLNEIDEQSKII